jgi:hypothetical protein
MNEKQNTAAATAYTVIFFSVSGVVVFFGKKRVEEVW